MWMITFLPFELANFLGDGFLDATPRMVKIVDGVPVSLGVSVDQENHIRLTLNHPAIDTPLHEEYLFSTPDEIFFSRRYTGW